MLLVLTAWLYAPAVGYGYVYEDTNDFRKWSASGPWLSEAWQKPARSLTALSYRVGQTLSGLEPWGYHLMSVGWHLLNGILLAVLASAVVGGGWSLPLVVGVFLLHPVQVESVAYISSQADLVSTCFILLALICAERGKLALSFLCCGLAVLGKETAIASFLLIPVWRWMRGYGLERGWIVASALPALLLLDRFPLSLDLAWMARTMTEAIGLLSLWLVPFPLTVEHDWSPLRLAVSLGVIVALIVVSAPARLALACAAALLFPRLFVPQLEGLHEHHLYAPSLILSLSAGLWYRQYAQEEVYGISAASA